jgi:hypothetical protein
MPSFFEGLKRLVSGQPVFRPGEDVDGVTHKSDQILEAQQQPTEPVVASAEERPGTKIIPEVIIERVEYRNKGDDMEVDVDIKNNSQQSVMVDSIMILGSNRKIGYVLSPGESREVPVYSGARPKHRNYTNCEMQYRDEATGDYFSSLHLVEYDAQEPDGTYTIRNIRFTPPIKDI